MRRGRFAKKVRGWRDSDDYKIDQAASTLSNVLHYLESIEGDIHASNLVREIERTLRDLDR